MDHSWSQWLVLFLESGFIPTRTYPFLGTSRIHFEFGFLFPVGCLGAYKWRSPGFNTKHPMSTAKPIRITFYANLNRIETSALLQIENKTLLSQSEAAYDIISYQRTNQSQRMWLRSKKQFWSVFCGVAKAKTWLLELWVEKVPSNCTEPCLVELVFQHFWDEELI